MKLAHKRLWHRKNSLIGTCGLVGAQYTTINQKGSTRTMKGESESSSAEFGEAPISELQRGRMQWLLAIFFTAFVISSGAHAQEHLEPIADTFASSQAAEPWQSDSDCTSPPVLLIPATLGGATTLPMKLIDGAPLTCSSSGRMPKPEGGVRRSTSSRASTKGPRGLTDSVAGFIDAESTNTSGLQPGVSRLAFSGLAAKFFYPSPPEGNQEFSNNSPPEGDPAVAELSG
ncbi:hypothetical protein [Paraburkholderia sp. RL18-085-BIA-A]|uniref:hypothetical protein n=1 Tax=Paraburkholderia sp. RL18-085-BIA-A TaxID=3031633 RepID=UPI0038B757EC